MSEKIYLMEKSVYDPNNKNKDIYEEATTSEAGLMSASDKTKLDGIATSANKYTHPSGTAKTGNPTANQTPAFGGTFTITQFTSNSTGHISGATDRTVKIPNTAATTSAAGLMSAADKTKLDGIATGATKITVDSALSSTSTNPVQNKVINTALSRKAASSHTHTKSQISDFPSSLPANGGNADTVDGYHADDLLRPTNTISLSDNYTTIRNVIADDKYVYREYVRKKANSSETGIIHRVYRPDGNLYSDLMAAGSSSGIVWNFVNALDVRVGGNSVLTSANINGISYVSGIATYNVTSGTVSIALGFKPSVLFVMGRDPLAGTYYTECQDSLLITDDTAYGMTCKYVKSMTSTTTSYETVILSFVKTSTGFDITEQTAISRMSKPALISYIAFR